MMVGESLSLSYSTCILGITPVHQSEDEDPSLQPVKCVHESLSKLLTLLRYTSFFHKVTRAMTIPRETRLFNAELCSR